jgi:hypothetical protein
MDKATVGAIIDRVQERSRVANEAFKRAKKHAVHEGHGSHA